MFQMLRPDGKPLEMVVIAHQESHFVINTRVIDTDVSDKEALSETIEEAIAKGPLSIGTLIVRKREYVEMLREVAERHNFQIITSKHLKAIQFFVKSAKRWSSDKEFTKTVDLDDFYFDAMDLINDDQLATALKILNKALEIDPYYVQTHIGLLLVYKELGDEKKCSDHTKIAYEETRKIFKTWPKTLSWHDLDNRKYHRAIFYRANLYIKDGEKENGIELYRQLLKMWPNDNQGVRYFIAGVYSGKSIREIEDMWDKCNDEQNWEMMEKMLYEQNKKHHFWKQPKE